MFDVCTINRTCAVCESENHTVVQHYVQLSFPKSRTPFPVREMYMETHDAVVVNGVDRTKIASPDNGCDPSLLPNSLRSDPRVL